MNDSVTIHDLELWTHIGVPAQERQNEQRLFVTVEMQYDLKQAASTDDVSQSIDYAQVVGVMKDLAKKERMTIETLAQDIADAILDQFGTERVTVQVRKKILPDCDAVSVTLTRP